MRRRFWSLLSVLGLQLIAYGPVWSATITMSDGSSVAGSIEGLVIFKGPTEESGPGGSFGAAYERGGGETTTYRTLYFLVDGESVKHLGGVVSTFDPEDHGVVIEALTESRSTTTEAEESFFQQVLSNVPPKETWNALGRIEFVKEANEGLALIHEPSHLGLPTKWLSPVAGGGQANCVVAEIGPVEEPPGRLLGEIRFVGGQYRLFGTVKLRSPEGTTEIPIEQIIDKD